MPSYSVMDYVWIIHPRYGLSSFGPVASCKCHFIRVTNSLDPDQAQLFVGIDLPKEYQQTTKPSRAGRGLVLLTVACQF